MAEKAIGAHDPEGESALDRDTRRKALARQIEEQVQRLSLIHDDLQKLVGQLREDEEDEEHG